MAARRKIFIEGVTPLTTITNVNHIKWTYSYDQDGILTVYRDGIEMAKRYKVKVGEAFFVRVWKGKTEVKSLQIPQSNKTLLMWLLSFKREYRAYNGKDYTKLLMRQRECYNSQTYHELSIHDEATTHYGGWIFTVCSVPGTKTVRRIAAMIHAEPDKDMVKDIIHGWTHGLQLGIMYPQTMVQYLLKTRFGFTDEDLREVSDIKYWLSH